MYCTVECRWLFLPFNRRRVPPVDWKIISHNAVKIAYLGNYLVFKVYFVFIVAHLEELIIIKILDLKKVNAI